MKIIKMLLAVLCFAACLLPITAQAANWQEVTKGTGGTLEINADNITRTNGIYTAWIRFRFAEGAGETINGQKVATRLEKTCFRTTETGGEFKCLNIYQYSAEGLLLESAKGNDTWDSVIPGTLSEDIYNKVLELRKDADAEDDKKAKRAKRAKADKEAANTAVNIAGAVLGGLIR